MTQTGTEQRATEIAEYHHGLASAEPAGMRQIGAGSQRTVYVDHEAGIVYKVGDNSANRHEVQTLATARAAGRDYAPEATLYTIQIPGPFGDSFETTVVAMPYLPEDGSVAGERPIFPEAADLNPAGNVHACRGQLWLIDAGGM